MSTEITNFSKYKQRCVVLIYGLMRSFKKQ